MTLERFTGRWQWQVAFFCFILAAITGFLYRLGMIYPLPAELSLQNIRHAHSHLMFFGWATPLPLFIFWKMIMIKDSPSHLNIKGTGIMAFSVWAILLFGLLSFPYFLLYGYHPVPIGQGELPLSVICSGLVMLGWYGFIGGYVKARRTIEIKSGYLWFDAALTLLFICSLGAWGVAVTQALDLSNPLFGKALTHFFLATFTEGWIVLVTLAIIINALKLDQSDFVIAPKWLIGLIVVGAPLTFPYGISGSLITDGMYYTARAGGILAAVSLLLVLYSILKSKKLGHVIWYWPLALLFVKALMQLSASIIPAEFWLSDHAFRILYLHILLLGAVTLTGVGYLHKQSDLSTRYYNGLLIAILAVLVTLVTLTRIWPVAWGGIWIFYGVAGASLLPVFALIGEWIQLRLHPEINHLPVDE